MLLAVYVFNFVDRQILSILAAPIQRDLQLDDAQMGLLGGVAFALLYSTLAVPLAVLADRTNRSWVITVSLVLWSGFTAACGLAQGFWHIFLARLGVGVGEAGGVAPSYALIGDYFPSNRRAFALSIYSLGIPLGSAAGVLAGGYIAAKVDWRLAFFAVGLCGVLLAPLFKLLVRDRPRPVAAPQTPTLAATFGVLARKPSFWFMAFGAAMSSMLGYGIAFWLPSLLQRSFGLRPRGSLAVLRRAPAVRRLRRRARRRLARRFPRRQGPRLQRLAAGGRLLHRRAAVRGRHQQHERGTRLRAASSCHRRLPTSGWARFFRPCSTSSPRRHERRPRHCSC